LKARAPLPRFIAGETNHCPGCGRSQWHIGRTTAECAYCSTAMPLAEQPASQPRAILRRGKGGGKVSRFLPAFAMVA
jgi:tRNA(Ile2) C34 agmatinyltransferase TiaS